MRFKDRVVLITGGSKGIGRAAAVAFADEGARVAITYKEDDSAAETTMANLKGGPHFRMKADLADAEQIATLVESVVKTYGRIDVLVNNAGIFIRHRIASDPFEKWQKDWENIINTNLTGAANMCYYVARQMIKQGGGRIVNVSSRGAFRGEPESPAYGASKAGLNSMSQSLAQALAPYNIYVGVIAPGWVETDMTRTILNSPEGEPIRNQSPLKRFARPEEVAYAILMFAGEGSEYMTGGIIDVNGASYLRS
jgi:3-oxoacyl-[acyl-carrier protein] reductase